MKQYCRYCANCYLQGDDIVWCEPKDQMRNKQQCSSVNNCKDFELNEIDVFDIDRTYKPRAKRKKVERHTFEQMSLI